MVFRQFQTIEVLALKTQLFTKVHINSKSPKKCIVHPEAVISQILDVKSCLFPQKRNIDFSRFHV